MSKFKVGDRVKRVVDTDYPDYGMFVRKGFVGKVLDVADDCIKVDDNAGGYNVESDFILAPAFPISSGGYIDTREFTCAERERFCELAVECGFGRGSEFERFTDSIWWALGVHKSDGHLFGYAGGSESLTTNITIHFREFLDKEKGMKQFTKDDLKDGMRCTHRDGTITIFVDGEFWVVKSGDYKVRTIHICIGDYDKNLEPVDDDYDCPEGFDIIRVTDRDGTVLFEREEKRKVTFELTEEQERELRKQLDQ